MSGCRGTGLLPALPPADASATLTVTPASITAGNHATLKWATTNATSVSIAPGIGTVAASGSTTVTPSATTQYTLTATGITTATASAKLTVEPAPPTATLTAVPPTIFSGSSSTLTWNTKNASTVSIAPGIGDVAASGSTIVMPANTTQYTLTATGSATTTATTTVTVQAQGSVNSPIYHVVIVMMQNHALDNLFGTYPGANGLDATLPSYHQVDAQGNTVSPTPVTTLSTTDLNHNRVSYVASWDNGKMDKFAYTNGDLSMQYYDESLSGLSSDKKPYGISNIWGYAQKYDLADNFFASAMNTEPANELYMTAATVQDAHTAGSYPYYDPCSEILKQKQGGSIAAPLTETNVGDQMTAKQVSWTWYQENFDTSQNGTCVNYVPQENIFQYYTSTQNSEHIQNYTTAAFQSVLDSGTLPSVSWIQPSGDHDMHPGGGNILDGIEWLDNFINMVKASTAWPNTAIVVLWDESGGWYDHVPPPQIDAEGLGMRVPVIIISPYAKTNYISHKQMDFVSILRFIQWNWNLGIIPASTQATREQQSGDLCDLLTTPCGAPQ